MKTSHRVPNIFLLPLQRKKQWEPRLDTVSTTPLNDTNVKWWLYENKGEENPSASHLSHHTLYFSEQQLPKHSALADICSLQLPETNHSLTLQDTQDIFPLCMRGWELGWRPNSYLLLFLRSTPRAGLRQSCRRSPCVPIPPGHCSAFSAQPAPRHCVLHGHLRTSEMFSSSGNPLVWERWGNTAITVPLLAWLSVPWADRATNPQRMSIQALENQHQQLPVTNEHLPTSQSVMFDSLWEQRD